MNPLSIVMFAQASPLENSANLLFRIIITVLLLIIWLGGIWGLLYLIHFCLTVPMRRAERARLFLDLAETSIAQGQPVEETIVSLAQSRERMLGVRFHLVAAHIENGLKFSAALEKVPRFLPPQISAILHAGEKLGDLKRVLPACRELLRDSKSSVVSAIHYMLLLSLVFSPAFVLLTAYLMTTIIPKMKEIAAGEQATLWFNTQFTFSHSGWLAGLEVCLFLFLLSGAAFYLSGPRLTQRLQFRGLPIMDWFAWQLPWKRKRLQRTFSAMLSVLLDGNVPEAEAIRLAGNCTVNEICRQRAQRVIAAIERGLKLDEAVASFDETGEFRWRLTNAIHARGGFLNALRGWHESLDAKAFQQQEATAHVVTSGLVILNGVLVALIATAMFGMLVAILESQL